MTRRELFAMIPLPAMAAIRREDHDKAARLSAGIAKMTQLRLCGQTTEAHYKLGVDITGMGTSAEGFLGRIATCLNHEYRGTDWTASVYKDPTGAVVFPVYGMDGVPTGASMGFVIAHCPGKRCLASGYSPTRADFGANDPA